MSEDLPQQEQLKEQRLKILRFLCILTYIGSGISALAFLFFSVFYDTMQSLDVNAFDTEMQENFKLMLSFNRAFFIFSFILYLISIRGAYLMHHLKKTGFHFYTASQILLLILPMLMIKGFITSGFNVFVTAAFIFAYSGFLKQMN
jgi:hypothetical protein